MYMFSHLFLEKCVKVDLTAPNRLTRNGNT